MKYSYDLFRSANNNVLALYSSFDEEPLDECAFCGLGLDDSLEFGNKISIDNISAHHFCLVNSINFIKCCSIRDYQTYSFFVLQLLSSNLKPCGTEYGPDQMFGFILNDIRQELTRASKLVGIIDEFIHVHCYYQ